MNLIKNSIMNVQLKTSLSVFFLGFLGILSMFIFPVPMEFSEEMIAAFGSETMIKLLSLIQSTVILIVMVVIGHFLTKKVGLSAPIITSFFLNKLTQDKLKNSLKIGIIIGLIAGIVMTLFTFLMLDYLPDKLLELNETMEINPITRFLYGGLTEEVLLRWGAMSLFVWILWKIFGRKQTEPNNLIFYGGIILSAFIFGAGHLPAVSYMVGDLTPILIIYIIVGNMLFGLIAGWLFWKKGIETAMITHIFAHVAMIGMEKILN